jgi:predicted TIM-barrel fold metal-dependent hydrolase
MNPSRPVIDSHVHIQPWKMVKAEALALLKLRRADAELLARIMYDPEALLGHLDAERIEKIVSVNYVSPDIMGFTQEVNSYAADYAKRCGGRVIPIGSVHPGTTKNASRDMDELIALGIRGIKLHPSHQTCYPNAYRNGNTNLETIYRKAEAAGLVLMVHTGTSIFPAARNVYADPIYVDDVAVDFPNLRIILAHGGRPLWMETCRFLIRRFRNVFMDVSSVPPQKLPEYFPWMEEHADKILWGSDWPAPGVPGMRANVDAFDRIPLSDAARTKILSANARTLYGL